MSLLFITHNLSIVRKLADSVAVMQNGRCVEQNTASTLLSAPQHPYTQRLLDSEPSGDPVPLDARRAPAAAAGGGSAGPVPDPPRICCGAPWIGTHRC